MLPIVRSRSERRLDVPGFSLFQGTVLNSGTSHNLGHGETIGFHIVGHIQSIGFRDFGLDKDHRSTKHRTEWTFWNGLFGADTPECPWERPLNMRKVPIPPSFETWTTNYLNSLGSIYFQSDLWFLDMYHHSGLHFWTCSFLRYILK